MIRYALPLSPLTEVVLGRTMPPAAGVTMRSAAVLSFLPGATLGLLACDSVAGPAKRPLTIQAAPGAAGEPGPQGAVLTYHVTNTGSSELYLLSCGDEILVAVERQEDGAWINTSAGMCLMSVGMTPVRIASGEAAWQPRIRWAARPLPRHCMGYRPAETGIASR